MKKKILISLIPFLLNAQTINLDSLEVNANDETSDDFLIQKEGYLNSAPMQKQISKDKALQIAGTNGDPIKAISSMAGVVSSDNTDGSEIYIHGSKPRETKFTLNHLPLGYLFHYGGLHSVIAPEATSQIDAYFGGFDVSYGAMGAVVDITPKYPTGENSGRVHIGLYDADFAVDGKINDNTSIFLGGRRSYFDLIANKIMDELDQDEDDKSKKTTFTVFPQFYDAQFLLSHVKGDNIYSIEAFAAEDKMKLHDTMEKDKDPQAVGNIDSKISSNTIGARWIHAATNFTSNTLLYRLNVKQKVDLFNSKIAFDAKSTEYGVYHETVFSKKNHKPMVGFEVTQTKIPLNAVLPVLTDDDKDEPLTQQETFHIDDTFNINVGTIFAQDIWSITNSDHFRYGIRAWDTNFQKFKGGVDPRFAYVKKLNKNQTLSFAIGKYSQFPEATSVIKKIGNNKIKTYESSNHYTLSFQQKFKDNSTLVLEPYYKSFKDLAIEDDEKNFKAVGEGKAYGVDITYKKRIKDFDMIFAYTYVDAKRQLNTQDSRKYSFEGDIPNTLQINTNYKFSNDWRFSTSFKYSDGKSYTPIVRTESYTYEGKNYKKPIYGKSYSKRLPSTVDLDIQFSKTYKYSKKRSLEVVYELMNVSSLLKKNVESINYNDDYEEDGKTYQMTFLPAVHLNYRF